MKTKLLLVFLLLSGFSASASPQQNINDYFIFQDDKEQTVPVYNGVITIERTPFSIRFFNKQFDKNNAHYVRLSVFTNKEHWKRIKSGIDQEKSPYFNGGSSFVFSNANYTYDGIHFSNEDGGSHFLSYEDTKVKALNRLKKVGEYYKLEFKIDTFILGAFGEKRTPEKVADSKFPEIYLALFNDKNLDNQIDEDELTKFTLKFK